jgi:LysR family glycine cleavage system transcriptional activator
MRDLPPLTQLRAFEAAARLLSFQDAATELVVTPTAISHQIQLLEQYLGTTLFRRRPRPLALTEDGARLHPVITERLASLAEAVAQARTRVGDGPLIVTTTNAFAARWLIPRLPAWQVSYPDIFLEVIGSDTVTDLHAGEAHLAIRYARTPPDGLVVRKLSEDRHWAACKPGLLSAGPIAPRFMDLRGKTLIHAHWAPDDKGSPTWSRFLAAARAAGRSVPDLDEMTHLRFREEAHAIDAAVAGQGIAMCSDVLVATELADGRLVKVFDLSLPGYGFFIVHLPHRTRDKRIAAFIDWITRMAWRAAIA